MAPPVPQEPASASLRCLGIIYAPPPLALSLLPELVNLNNHHLASGVVHPVGDDEALNPNMLYITTVRVPNPVV